MKQRTFEKSENLRRYHAQSNQYKQNKLFRCNQKALCKELGGKERSTQVLPNTEKAKELLSKVWDSLIPYKENAEWLKEVDLELENVNIQENAEITKKNVTKQLRNKRFTNQHQRLTEELNKNMHSLSIPSWLVKSKTVLIQKDPAKGNAVGNYRPIAFLNLLWKLKTSIIADKLYQYENENLLLEEQKGCQHASRGTKDQLLIDKDVIRNCKRRKTNLNMVWVDFRKSYDMVLHA